MGEIDEEKSNPVLRITRSFVIGELYCSWFFDGAAQEGGFRCGAGVVLKCIVLGI